MPNNFNNRSLAVSQRIYGQLLRAYPPAHREEYGPAMAQLFRDQSRDAWKEARGWGMTKLWLRVLPDLVNTSIVERLSALNPKKTMTDKISAATRPATAPLAVLITVFAIVFSLALTASIIITFILPDSYASTCRINVGADAPQASGRADYDPYFIGTAYEIIQSQIVLDPVIAKLNLNVQWGKKYSNGETLKTAESLKILKARMSLAPIRNTRLIDITVYSEDRNEAAQIANAIAEAYRDYRNKSRDEMYAKGMSALQLQYKNEEVQIQTAQSDLESLRRTLGINLDATTNQGPHEQPYWDKQRDLQKLLEIHKLFYSKIHTELIAAQMPRASLVQITDPAEPGFRPVRPNKPLNIFIGAVVGGFLGLIAGGGAALVTSKLEKRGIHVVSA